MESLRSIGIVDYSRQIAFLQVISGFCADLHWYGTPGSW
jgi:hypothetical protein